jgi:Golgi phosphoprotein 3 GPP34
VKVSPVGGDIVAVVFNLERFMTTPRDLLMVAIDMESGHPLEQGDLSLALAGAELIELLGVQAVRLDGERIVPLHQPATGDRLLDEAASLLVRHEPYESVVDWLWRRGRGLFSSYLAALEAAGQVTRQRLRGSLFRTSRLVLVDSPAHREAAKRWTADDAVLTALAATVGLHGERTAEAAGIANDAVATVLAAVNDAVMELGLARQRRDIEDAAFDNIWRGG